jgi:hypothetical protein
MSQERKALDGVAIPVMLLLTSLWGFQHVTARRELQQGRSKIWPISPLFDVCASPDDHLVCTDSRDHTSHVARAKLYGAVIHREVLPCESGTRA